MKFSTPVSLSRVHFLASFRHYRAAWLIGDLGAGIMLAAIAIPEQLATAKLANFPLETGLYAFAAGTLAFAVVGTNRFVSVGADSTIAPIFAASLAALGTVGGPVYIDLGEILAIGVGSILLLIGILRAGWVADLLSVPVTTGILAGIAVNIITGQLPSFLGLAGPAGPLLFRLAAIATQLPRVNPATCVLGFAVLAVTIGSARLSDRIPGALLGLIGAGIAVAALHLQQHGVAVLDRLRLEVPALRPPGIPDTGQLIALAPLALVVSAVCALQTSIVVRSFAAATTSEGDLSQDFAAVGVGSILAAFVGAFPVNASPPRTALVQGAGGRSQLSGLIAVVAIAVLVGYASGFATYVPQAALAAVLIFIALRIFRVREMLRIWRFSRGEINLVIASALLVVVLPIQTGMLLAIMLSLAHGVTLVMWPSSTQLFWVRGSTIWWPAGGGRVVEDLPGVIVFAPAAPVTFMNAAYIHTKLLSLIGAARAPVKLVVVEASGVTDIDYTGSQMFKATIGELRGRRIEVAVARLIDAHAARAAARSGLIATLGADRVFLSVQEAVAACNVSNAGAR